MEFMGGYFWLIILLPVIFGIVTSLGASSKQSSFSSLGNVRGLSSAEIISRVGQPCSVSVIGPNQTLMQWQTTGYHIALNFTGDICDGISSEFSTNGTTISGCGKHPLSYNVNAAEKNQLDYEFNYLTEKNLFFSTGKVSNWDEEGRIPYDFEKWEYDYTKKNDEGNKSNNEDEGAT